VTSSFHLQRLPLLRLPRRFFAAFVLMMYLLAGALHGFCDLDVANNSGPSIITSMKNDFSHDGKGAVAEHHCHGCFSVALPELAAASLLIEPTQKMFAASSVLSQGLSPGIDPPPPKSLA